MDAPSGTTTAARVAAPSRPQHVQATWTSLYEQFLHFARGAMPRIGAISPIAKLEAEITGKVVDADSDREAPGDT